MNYYKNIQVARKFNVSNTTVARWIEYALSGKVNLQLFEKNEKNYILDNVHNNALMEQLKDEGQKFRSGIVRAKVQPNPEFYQIFNEEQIIEIINDLEITRSVEHKFTYLNGGAKNWDKFYNKSVENGEYPTLNRVINLLRENTNYLLYKIGENIKVNIIDVGPGNGHPVKIFVEELSKLNKLNKYIAVDISDEINQIAIKNIHEWFPNVKTKSYIYDIDHSNFIKSFFQDKLSNDHKVINLVLYLGGTVGIHMDRLRALKNIRETMSKDDIFVFSNSLESSLNIVNSGYYYNEEIEKMHTWICSLIGIDISSCELETRFEPLERKKVMKLKLDKDYEISFNVLGVDKKVILMKGEAITLWRHQMTDMVNLISELEQARLQIIQLSTEKDLSHVLVVCQAKN